MAKCENCYHRKACIDSANYKNSENCRRYKDKSLIVELPCKPGDVLYEVQCDYDSASSYIEKIKCNSIEISDCGISIYCKTIEGNYDTCIPEDFGKIVFLSREEAERALEEREKNG